MPGGGGGVLGKFSRGVVLFLFLLRVLFIEFSKVFQRFAEVVHSLGVL